MSELNTRINQIHRVPVFHASEMELVPDKVTELIQRHMLYRQRYQLLEDYYIGKHAICSRTMDENKPNNKLVTNFAQYITDVKSGYFLGVPVSYTMKTGDFEPFQQILDYNDEQDNNSELAKLLSIHGHAFELLYLDETGTLRFHYESPKNLLMVYDTSIEEWPTAAIRYKSFDVEGSQLKTIVKAELYTKDHVVYLEGDVESGLTVKGEKPHPFRDIPVVEYKNNDERLGDFENVISLIDAYELVMSDSTNELQYFSDAYLVIRNLLATDSNDIAQMKNNRVISLDEDGEANWLVKDVNDKHIQNLLDRLKKDIHKFSKTPNLSDEEFVSNLSGVAIRYKLWGLEQDAANKERKFKRGLMKRFLLMCDYLSMVEGKDFKFSDVKITFTRNIPENILEQVQMLTGLNGMVSQETLLSQLPFIDDVAEELAKLQQEQEKALLTYGTTENDAIGGGAYGDPSDNKDVLQAQKEDNGEVQKRG